MRPNLPRLDLGLTQEVLLAYGMQAFVCLALALLLFSFARRDPLPQLRWWTWSWIALLVYLGTAAFSISVISKWHWPAGDWRRLLISSTSLAAGLMQPCFVAMGAFESVRERPISSSTRRTLLAVVVIAAIAFTFATLSLPATNTLRLSARYVLAGTVFVAAAVSLMRSGVRDGSRGPIVLAWSALAYGLGQFHGLFWLVRREVTGTIEVFPFYLGFGDVLLQMFLGLGMLMWHLEAQRERAQRALVDLERSQEALRHTQRMESVGRLAGGVAHDFNNLMTIMVAATEDLEAHHPARTPGNEAIQHLKDAVHRAKSLTSQLLAFSRKQVTQPERVDLAELVALQERMLTRLLGTEVVLERETTSARLPVMADPSQFTQVLMNLVVNARDAMREGGVMSIATGEVAIGPTDGERLQVPPGRYAAVAVRDNGTGMTEEVRARVFEPFFTTKPVGEGTGLGLATAYGIVRNAGGAIEVDSVLGRGTTVTVLWPLTDAGPAPASASTTTIPAPLRQGTVLLVEDDEPIRNLLQRILSKQGLTVIVAQDGAEALMRFRGAPSVDLVVTDVLMPGMDGGQLITSLRETRPDLRVLAVSGYAGDLESRRFPDDIAWLQKPFSSAEFTAAVLKVLDAPAAPLR